MNVIGKTAYGTAYAFDGAVPFSAPDVSSLKWGDSVRDNGGKGMTLYVNDCCHCERTFLAGTLIMVPERGPCCGRGSR